MKKLRSSRQITSRKTIVDQYGKPAKIVTPKAKYDSLNTNSQYRSTNIKYGSEENDHITTSDRSKMISIARDAYRNNSLAKGLATRFQDLVVGTGNLLQVKTKDKQANKQAEDFFNRAWGVDLADGRGKQSFSDIQRMAFLEWYVTGDFLTYVDTPNMQLYTFEAEQLLTPSDWQNKIKSKKYSAVDGVIIDRKGKPLKYMISPDAKKSSSIKDCMIYNDYSMIHVAEYFRSRQVRGVSNFVTTMHLLNQLIDMIKAELTSAKISSKFAVAITKKNANQLSDIMSNNDWDTTDDEEEGTTAPLTTDEQADYTTADRLEEILDGAIEYLNEGEGIEIIQNNRPNNNFDSFLQMAIRLFGTGASIPLEIMMMDFSNNSFSSNRASLMLAWTHIIVLQQWFDRVFNIRVAKKILNSAIEQKIISLPAGWEYNLSFSHPGIPSVDRLKDESAKTKALDNQTTTLQAEISKAGDADFEDVIEQRTREQMRLADKEKELLDYRKKLGLDNNNNEGK